MCRLRGMSALMAGEVTTKAPKPKSLSKNSTVFSDSEKRPYFAIPIAYKLKQSSRI